MGVAAHPFDRLSNPEDVQRVISLIATRSRQPIYLMEFCGGHTHAIFRFGLRQLLPPTIHLLTGPGCPVCVTAHTDLDLAIALAFEPDVILTSFGDMMRVPGSRGTLLDARAQGADVRIVYSSRDALEIARSNPDRQVVFLAIGFETTAPTVAAVVRSAMQEGIGNFSIFSLHKRTPPAMRAVLDSGQVKIDGIIGPGHVTTIVGAHAWEFLPEEYGMPCAVAGFEPLDILYAIYMLVDMIERRAPAVSNTYTRSVREEGNKVAQQLIDDVFETCEASWRGLGKVGQSGLHLRGPYAALDARVRFPVSIASCPEPKGCCCGDILRGVSIPTQCPLFATACVPEHPIGPCMVSAEGACAAYFKYNEETYR